MSTPLKIMISFYLFSFVNDLFQGYATASSSSSTSDMEAPLKKKKKKNEKNDEKEKRLMTVTRE